jgi:hypothetical protein
VTKPKKPRPAIAWCVLNADGNIRPGWVAGDKATVARWAETFGREMIRVEIRPAPKRRRAGRKS